MLKGEKKKTYQRNYMRTWQHNKRAKVKLNGSLFRPQGVECLDPIKPIDYDADGYPIYDP